MGVAFHSWITRGPLGKRTGEAPSGNRSTYISIPGRQGPASDAHSLVPSISNGFDSSNYIRAIAFIEDLCQQVALEGLHEPRALIHDDIFASIPVGYRGDDHVDVSHQLDLILLVPSLHFQFGQFDLDAMFSESLIGLTRHRRILAINIEDGLVELHVIDFALELFDESS